MADVLRNMLLGISLAAPLGPAGVAVIQNGLQRGLARAFATGVGVTMAGAAYLLAVCLGLASLQPAVKVLIWAGGALALVYLGVQSIRLTPAIVPGSGRLACPTRVRSSRLDVACCNRPRRGSVTLALFTCGIIEAGNAPPPVEEELPHRGWCKPWAP